MTFEKDAKKEVIDRFRIHESDSGSTEVQIALLTRRIVSLTKHFQTHEKDTPFEKGTSQNRWAQEETTRLSQKERHEQLPSDTP